jgi:CheY-like chemotaxis protein
MSIKPDLAAARILLVEDNPTNMKLTADLLEYDGFQVYRAADAEQARVILQSVLPDLILTDIDLPGMDGLTLACACKSNERLRHIPVVAITAFAMTADERAARAAGCDGYITKPIKTRELAHTLRSYLRPRRPDGQDTDH